ncbi:MAG: LysM peptidoglycan-binding domain-containing protein, partial [Anaerolineaceae bacterium]|nr:LysM peptidoglycan-binding domain-containing protein [Anaerolineaceae bacterium]
MRAFFVLVIFFLAFLLFASSMMVGVDLTPSTAQAAAPLPASQPQSKPPIIPTQRAAILPVSGGCSDPYTVRSGDTFSQIAVTCNTTLAVLTQINPQMSNINCIYPGQQINIRNGSAVQLPANCRVAITRVEAAPPVEVAAPLVALPETCACYTTNIPI